MHNITQLLYQTDEGDQNAAEQLLPLVYDELCRLGAVKMAEEGSDHKLQATALVQDAYLRLVGSGDGVDWNSRGHFCGAVAQAMRRLPAVSSSCVPGRKPLTAFLPNRSSAAGLKPNMKSRTENRC